VEELPSQESWPHDISLIKSTFRHLSISRQGILVTIRPQPAATSESVIILIFFGIPDIDLFWHMRCSGSVV
jgi:hypothetical protein